MNFYVSIFKNSKILDLVRYGDAGPGPKGTVMAGTFQLEGQMLADKNPVKSKRVMEAMLQMSKIDIGRLTQAYEQTVGAQLPWPHWRE
jgi:predicted 3-demethylubiquinone-9 3-methyltransferase (glyoxalase superfamily)